MASGEMLKHFAQFHGYQEQALTLCKINDLLSEIKLSTLVPEALTQRGRDSKRKILKRREGPLASAVENLTSMLSTSIPAYI